MKKNPLLGALPILAKMLGRRLGVQVVIGGSKAQTDGQTIHLPALPVDDTALAVLDLFTNNFTYKFIVLQ